METKERYFINHSGELLDETMPLESCARCWRWVIQV